ncbi:thiazole tautomerase (transcriptional regulator TenI) [Sinobaca qinghaiensis]|uniref:Thiazole tautomerase (Transcriptional regulator TenI) n=1 Tax=Sinobaca qinghaiensis TaxID=342944 RepID=A0A419V4C4_9BACL|nr:thiamine phosphate synthase [Sinobaca qinghaiensis]RKD73292.1 thiazole tautomerase (transcriptional regulator TenI) [Sinobaca qinghaiensis]
MNIQRNELHAVSTGRQTLEEWMYISKKIKKYTDCFHVREPLWSLEELRTAIEFLQKEGVAPEQIRLNIPEEKRSCFSGTGFHLKEAAVQKPEQSLITGWSVHSREAAREKEQAGADYLFFGHVFSTASKQDLQPRGLQQLSIVARESHLPVIAIGGITPEQVKACIRSGAAGIAVLSGLYEAADPEQQACAYSTKLNKEGK